MKHRVVFLSQNMQDLADMAKMLDQSHLTGWSWCIASQLKGDIERTRLPMASTFVLTDIAGCTWRGGFWGLALGWLLVLIVTASFNLEAGDMRTILIYALPSCLMLFGAWEGGILGLMRNNPALDPYQDYIRQGHHILLIDVHDVDLRLLKKIMAMCSGELLGAYCRRLPGFPWRPYAVPDQAEGLN
jgi:hypothetical protein